MTDEQLLKTQNKMYENLKPFIEKINRIWEAVKELFIKVWIQLKKFLEIKVSIRTKSFKKGKKYIHSYKKIELWKWVKLYVKSRNTYNCKY